MAEASVQRPDYERSDASPPLLIALSIGLAVYLFATPFILLAFYPGTRHDPTYPAVTPPPAPRLEVDPAGDLHALRLREESRLSTFGWVDRAAGVVHLPIGRAMELTVQRGLPGWPQR